MVKTDRFWHPIYLIHFLHILQVKKPPRQFFTAGDDFPIGLSLYPLFYVLIL